MIELTQFFVLAMVLAAVLTSIALWAPRKLWIKLAALGVMAGFVPVAYASMSDLLSRPKPVGLAVLAAAGQEAKVLGAQLREGEAIYLWLQLPEVPEPRYYKLAWHEQTARELHQAMRDAEERNSGVVMQIPTDPSPDKRERIFHPEPQPKLPDKYGGGRDGPLEYRSPGSNV